MMSLGIVLALNHLYNNWTIAGTMSAAYILAVSAVTPFYARLFDRLGQRRVGFPVLGLQVTSMLVFAFAAMARVPIAVLFVLAILMGLCQFSIGALVRTRWAYALRDNPDGSLLNTAYALEAAVDEVVFILGPILAAFLATSVSPVSQLFVPAIAAGAGGAVFFSLRNTAPPVIEVVEITPAPADDADVLRAASRGPETEESSIALDSGGLRTPRQRNRSVLTYPGIALLLAVFVVFNVSFNAFDVSMTADYKTLGNERFLGLQLAMFALGSCIGAIIFGTRKLKGSNWSHMVGFLFLLTCGYVLFRLSMDHLILLGVFEVLAGLCVSPLFATGNLIVKDIVPESSLTEGLSWVTTAGTVGTSLGSTIAGVVVDHAGPHAGLMIPWIATACAIPIALLGWWLSQRSAPNRQSVSLHS